MANTTIYALVANDLHGIKSREDAFFDAVRTYRNQIGYIILNGDIFGGQHVGRLQKMFYDVKNPFKGDYTREDVNTAFEAFCLLEEELIKLAGAGYEPDYENRETVMRKVCKCYHYGVFLSCVCKNSPVLRTVFEQDILNGIKVFFESLNTIKPKNCVVILNTGNWEEATPLDFDPTDLTTEKRVSYDERLSRQIEQVCEEYGAVFNEGFRRICRTGIVGAKAIIDAAKNNVGFGVRADQMICHYPNEYARFPEHQPSEKDLFCSEGVNRWLLGLGAKSIWHGHIHSDGYKSYGSSHSIQRQDDKVTFSFYAHKVGLHGYALVQL